MKTIVIGFKNENGNGASTVIKGEEVSHSDQVKFIQKAKSDHVFPDGIKRLELCTVDPIITAIKIEKTETKKSESKKDK